MSGDLDPVVDLARRINAADGPKVVAYVAGGGTEVFPMLLAHGGGSNTLLAGRIPYAPGDFASLIGRDPGQFVAEPAARALAMAAYRHALAVRGAGSADRVFGLGATAKLGTGPGERVGRTHAVHAAIQDGAATRTWALDLPAGLARAAEEHLVARFLLDLIADGRGVADRPALPIGPGRSLRTTTVTARDLGQPGLADLFAGRVRAVGVDLPGGGAPPRGVDEAAGPPTLLLPGSFRPLHDGHRAMAAAATRLAGAACAFEVSVTHPEKPPLDHVAIRDRLNGFREAGGRVYLTDAPTYVAKARVFPGATFVVGHDTALRIVDPRFYGGPIGRDAMLDELASLGTRFLVFGRVDASGQFRDFAAEAFDHPSVARFVAQAVRVVPEADFRLDLSSTEVRRRLGQAE